jgi:hypothetical protein
MANDMSDAFKDQHRQERYREETLKREEEDLQREEEDSQRKKEDLRRKGEDLRREGENLRRRKENYRRSEEDYRRTEEEDQMKGDNTSECIQTYNDLIKVEGCENKPDFKIAHTRKSMDIGCALKSVVQIFKKSPSTQMSEGTEELTAQLVKAIKDHTFKPKSTREDGNKEAYDLCQNLDFMIDTSFSRNIREFYRHMSNHVITQAGLDLAEQQPVHDTWRVAMELIEAARNYDKPKFNMTGYEVSPEEYKAFHVERPFIRREPGRSS